MSEPTNSGAAANVERCPSCGGDAGDNMFDRSICPPPCDSMHTRCVNCGHALDGCRWEQEHDPDGSVPKYAYAPEEDNDGDE